MTPLLRDHLPQGGCTLAGAPGPSVGGKGRVLSASPGTGMDMGRTSWQVASPHRYSPNQPLGGAKGDAPRRGVTGKDRLEEDPGRGWQEGRRAGWAAGSPVGPALRPVWARWDGPPGAACRPGMFRNLGTPERLPTHTASGRWAPLSTGASAAPALPTRGS